MARKVITAPEALSALKQAKKWLRQPGAGETGLKRWRALQNAGKSLRQNPYLAPASTEIPNHRQLVVSGYRVIYDVNPDTGDSATAGDIRIVAVFGPGQETRWP